jgi:hypothetical protein
VPLRATGSTVHAFNIREAARPTSTSSTTKATSMQTTARTNRRTGRELSDINLAITPTFASQLRESPFSVLRPATHFGTIHHSNDVAKSQ